MTADLKINAFGGRNSGSTTCEIRRDRLRLSPRNKASWCNGSTRDSGSLCLGSNPSEAAKPSQNIPRRFSQNTRTQKALSRTPNAARARFVLAASIREQRAERKRAGKTSSARAKSERFSTGESGARVAEKPARQ